MSGLRLGPPRPGVRRADAPRRGSSRTAWPRDDRSRARARRLEVDLPGAVPGWVVRLVPSVLVLVVIVSADRSPIGTAVGSVLAVLAAIRPRAAVAAGLAVLLAAAALVRGGPAFAHGAAPVAWQVLGVHLVLAGQVLARHVSWRSTVDPAAIGAALRDLLPAQLVAQLLVLLAWALAGGPAEPWWRLVGVAAMVGLALLAFPTDRSRRR
ncbi:hypothetical protein OEB99_01220 [Actinotalea sp. M2MS4P-6]|uniref:hypothetical protein n=1 Tax=Actinotalea sp. M2MS4P-6 TaxID=2983762 RepID=UPI0021E3E92B|nr:hypothetical protein [Actinotalea sp. M2MS4P-6]MCV2392916.1 hypothetical protein [Actinotalea sp. M2MS4P-6]